MENEISESWRQMAEAIYKSTIQFEDYFNKEIQPLLLTFSSLSVDYPDKRFDQVTVGTYLRAVQWLRIIAKLNNVDDFQAVLSGTRTVYELLIDLKILEKEPERIEAYCASVKVIQYEFFKKFENVAKKYPDHVPKHFDQDSRREFLVNPNIVAIYEDAKQKWKENGKSEHWSGKSMPARIEDILCDIPELFRYRDTYPWLCWYVHPGATGFVNFSANATALAFIRGHTLLQVFFAEMTDIICRRHFLYEGKPELRDSLKSASLKGWERISKLPSEMTEPIAEETAKYLKRLEESKE